MHLVLFLAKDIKECETEGMGTVNYHHIQNPNRELVEKAKYDATIEIAAFSIGMFSGTRAIGSGTLVHSGQHFGILTAHHVSDCWKEDEPLFLNISQQDHSFVLQKNEIEHKIVGKWIEGKKEGPDLALFKILCPNRLGIIKSKKTFYNLDLCSVETVLEHPPENMMWWAAGVPQEFAVSSGSVECRDLTTLQILFHAELTFDSLITSGEFDYLKTSVHSGAHGFPERFNGMSGGGIWRSGLRLTDESDVNSITYLKPVLAGVTQRQGDLIDGRRGLIGHGPHSVYHRAKAILTGH